MQSIKEYYTFDTLLIKELKETKEKSEKNIKGGYLINKKWLDKWKTYTQYENIKKEFLSEDLKPENDEKIKETIIKRNIYNQDFNMGDIDVFNFNSSSEIKAYLQKESIILVGEKFYKLFIEKSKDKIKFSSNKRMITIYFNKNINKDKDKYDIEAYNNILSLDINNCNKMIDNLIKIYIFQEQLKLKIEKEKYRDNNVIDIKLVDKKWFTSIKKKYNFSHLLEIIKDKKEIKDEIKKLDISNYNPILSKIQKEIPEDYFYEIYNNIDIIKENDKNIKFTLENKSINIELSKMFNKNKKREYLVNIELIDCQLFNDLIYKKHELISKDGKFFIDNHKILIKYDIFDNQYIFSIGYINNDNTFISEYLIESININELNDLFYKKDIKMFLQFLKVKNEFGYYYIHNKKKETIGICYELILNEKDYNKNEIQNIDNNNKIIKGIENDNDFKKNIGVLLELYEFNKELKSQIKDSLIQTNNNSKINNKYEFYLIKEEWFSKYKKIYLYDEINEFLLKTNEDPSLNKESKIKDLFIKYIDIYKKKEYKEKIKLINIDKLFNLEFQFCSNGKEIIFFSQYYIVNKNILDKIVDNKIGEIENFISIIYNKKIILKHNKKNCIIIGDLSDDNNNIFIPEIILKYKDMININEKFINEEFLKLINIKDGKIESIKEIEEIKQNLEIDEIYFIDKTKYNNITHINKYIKLLYHLYYHYKEFNSKKNSQFTQLEKCYIISKKYMDKIKDIFNYDEFCKGIEDNKIKDIINKYKELYKNEANNVNNLINYDEFYLEFKNNFSIKFLECILSINNENDLNNKDLIKLNKYQLKVNEKGEDKYLSYYSNFEIISEKLEENKIINHFIINKKKEKAEFLISNNKLILYPSLNNESILIIEDINNNNELIPELLIHFEDSTKLKAFIEQIKKNGYNNLISELNFIQQKASIINNETKNLDGKAYQINIKDSKENKEEISLLKGTIIPNEEKKQQKVGNEENNKKDVSFFLIKYPFII